MYTIPQTLSSDIQISPLMDDIANLATSGRFIYPANAKDSYISENGILIHGDIQLPVALIRVTKMNLDYEKEWIEWYESI